MGRNDRLLGSYAGDHGCGSLITITIRRRCYGSQVADDAWHALALSLDGSVVLPSDDGYDTARQLFNRRFDDLRPAAIARMAHADDVVECVTFARKHALPITVRSGGHAYEGWSSGDGRLVIDVGGLAQVDADASTATVGAGTRLGSVYRELDARGRTIPAGSCPTVGVSGLTLGGGHGVLSRMYGLTCDSLVGATIVTADGAVLECSAESEPELFWALRGAGNGHFGVVTELRFVTHDAPSTVTADLTWPWDQAPGAVAAWQTWAPDLADEYWTTLRLGRNGGGDPIAKATVMSLTSADDLAVAVDRLLCPPDHAVFASHTWAETVNKYAGTEQSRPAYRVRSAFVDRSLSSSGTATLAERVTRTRDSIDVSIALVAMGGAINRVDPLETAFVHRRHRLLMQAEAYWTVPPGDRDAADWLARTQEALRPHVSGSVYQNCPDPGLANSRRAYYGPAVDRLARLKKRYDPDRLFDPPQAL